MTRQRTPLPIIVLGLVLLGGFMAFMVSLLPLVWQAPCDPDISVKALAGLTPQQVMAKLGSPFDSFPSMRSSHFPAHRPWSPEEEAKWGPLELFYYDSFFLRRGHSYMIVFKHNRVVKVVCVNR